MEQCVGTCSICGGDVMKHVGVWHGTIPPRGRCSSCGAVEASGPVIPMRPVQVQRIPRLSIDVSVPQAQWQERHRGTPLHAIGVWVK